MARARPAAVHLLSLALLTPVAAPAQPPAGEPDRAAELEAIRGEIARLQARATRMAKREVDLAGKLASTELSIQLQSKRLEEASAARRLAEETLVAVETQVGLLEERLASVRRDLGRRLSDLYRLGRQGYLRLLLSIRQERHLLPGIRQLRYIVRRDARLLDRFIDARARLDHERRQLLGRRREVEEWQRREASRFEELNRLRLRQAQLVREVERERRSVSAAADRLIDKERKLANLLDFLVGRTAAPLVGTPIQGFRGVLDWPARAPVVERFGPRQDPVYGTQVPHNGVDLGTTPESEVRVVYPGTVVFASPFRGHGMTVVVHHPGRVFTLYAGLRRLLVRQDDVLSFGQALGLAGERLYFEIRIGNQPEDPLDWLR